MDKISPAVVFGLPETGLAIGRSLGRNMIDVYGICSKKEIGRSSKYIRCEILPHPILYEEQFKVELKSFCERLKSKPVLFIASDEYLSFYQTNNNLIDNLFRHNLPNAYLLSQISDKYLQYQLALEANINVPKTVFVDNSNPIEASNLDLEFPIFVKARDVNIWRRVISDSKKGFVIQNPEELEQQLNLLNEKNVPVIFQEIVRSKDDQNYKACVLISDKGDFKLIFTLRKIHQCPIHFGIASSAVSIKSPLLEEIARRLFSSIGYKGIGSAEFKFDEKDSKFKLIEINPRYWQQNALADFCGMNFPLYDYMLATNQSFDKIETFHTGYKWLNLSLNISSYKDYRKEGSITFFKWLRDIKGKKTISFFAWDDLMPFVIFLFRRLGVVKSKLKRIIKQFLRK